MTFLRVAGVASLSAILSACASVEIMPLAPGAAHNSGVEGYVFYAPQPYLAIAQSEHGGCAMSVVYLPDMRRPYRANVQSGFGSVAFSPSFANGWMLTEAGVTIDNNGDEILSALTGLIPGAAPPENGRDDAETCFIQGLYRLDIDRDQNITLEPVIGG